MMVTKTDEHIARCERDVRIAQQRVTDAQGAVDDLERDMIDPQEHYHHCERKALLKVAKETLRGCHLELKAAQRALYNARHG